MVQEKYQYTIKRAVFVTLFGEYEEQKMNGNRNTIVSRIMSPLGVGLLATTSIGGYYLLTQHANHVVSLLPFGFIFLCPLMHLFMMRGHGHDHTNHNDDPHTQPAPVVEPFKGQTR